MKFLSDEESAAKLEGIVIKDGPPLTPEQRSVIKAQAAMALGLRHLGDRLQFEGDFAAVGRCQVQACWCNSSGAARIDGTLRDSLKEAASGWFRGPNRIR